MAADGPGGASATHSSDRVKKGNAVLSLSPASADESERPVLDKITSSFRLL